MDTNSKEKVMNEEEREKEVTLKTEEIRETLQNLMMKQNFQQGTFEISDLPNELKPDQTKYNTEESKYITLFLIEKKNKKK